MFFELNRWELSSKPEFGNAFGLTGGQIISWRWSCIVTGEVELGLSLNAQFSLLVKLELQLLLNLALCLSWELKLEQMLENCRNLSL